MTVSFAEAIRLQDIIDMIMTSAKAGALGYPTLVDARDATIAFFPHDVEAIFATHADWAKQYYFAKLAVLVNGERALAIMAEVGELLCQISPVCGFLDRAAAERWLGWLN